LRKVKRPVRILVTRPQPDAATFAAALEARGHDTFIEPMMTKAFLETRPNLLTPVAVPRSYSRPGYYPVQYGVRYDAAQREYGISLEGLALR